MSLARAQLSVPLLSRRAAAVAPGAESTPPATGAAAPSGDPKATPAAGNDSSGSVGTAGTNEGGDKVALVSLTFCSPDGGLVPQDTAAASVPTSSDCRDADGDHREAPPSGGGSGSGSGEGDTGAGTDGVALDPPPQETPTSPVPSRGGNEGGDAGVQLGWGLCTDVVKILAKRGTRRGHKRRKLARRVLRAGDADRLLICLGRLEGEAPPTTGGRADRFDDPEAVAERARRREEEGEGRKNGSNVRNLRLCPFFGDCSESWFSLRHGVALGEALASAQEFHVVGSAFYQVSFVA